MAKTVPAVDLESAGAGLLAQGGPARNAATRGL